MPDGDVITRTCRSCGAAHHVALEADRCPDCGTAYGRIVFGLDVDPAEAARMDRDRQRVTDEAYRRDLDEARREQVRRAVYGDDGPSK